MVSLICAVFVSEVERAEPSFVNVMEERVYEDEEDDVEPPSGPRRDQSVIHMAAFDGQET